jgi:hypothetical protein
MVGPLPPPRVLNIDHGRQRFLLFRLEAPAEGPCTAPAMAWLSQPASGQSVSGRVELSGWAFKDGVGLDRVEVLVDGVPAGELDYGRADPGVAIYWRVSNDPQHPNVGFDGEVDLGNVSPGRHWIGLRLHGNDGSIEDWSEQPVSVAP